MKTRSLVFIFPLLMAVFMAAPLLWGAEEDEEEPEQERVKTVKGKVKNITLPVGVSKTLEFPFDIGPIHLTDPNLFDFRRVPGENRKLYLKPNNPGYTDMTIHDAKGVPKLTYYVRVTREDVGQVISQLEELLGDIEGLKVKSVGGTIVLDGDILLPKDMVRIIRVVDAMKDARDPKKRELPIRNLANISKVTMNIIAERIEREIGSPEITARVLNNNIFLEGTAQSEFEAERAAIIAKTYLPEAFLEKNKGEGGEIQLKKAEANTPGSLPGIIDLLRLAPRPAAPPASDIKITMNYVELLNEYEKSFNFEWRPLASDSSTIRYDSSLGELSANVVATITSLFPRLNTAKNHGHARILKQEQIIVKDKADNPAAIESSIDLYTRVVDEKGVASLTPISVQNATRVRASTITGSDTVELGIQITLNSLLGEQQGAPIIAKNSIQTQVTIKNGESAALGGYAIDEALAGYNREPSRSVSGGGSASGGSTPLLNFQRSKKFRRNKQQFVIFVTPEILRTASAGTEDITRKFRLNAGEK